MPLACFTVAFRQNVGFWRERRRPLSSTQSWASQPPAVLRMALDQGYLELLGPLQYLLVLLRLHVEGLVG